MQVGRDHDTRKTENTLNKKTQKAQLNANKNARKRT